jgi:tetratricopeptide (TPR) repeat protein
VVRLKKKKEHHSEHEGLDEALKQIETHGDQLARWVGENSQQVLIAIGLVLLVAASVSYANVRHQKKENAAFAAVGAIDYAFKQESGLINDLGESAQLANPETLKELRDTYSQKFTDAADEHAGTAGAAMSLFQAGVLVSQGGDEEGAVQKWEEALEQASGNRDLEALIRARLASGYESLDRWVDAAEAYESLATEDSIYGEKRALADAARCYFNAGDSESAQKLIEGLRGDEDLEGLPPYLKAKIEALRS